MKSFSKLLLTGTAVAALSGAAGAQESVPQAQDSYFQAAAQDLEARLAVQPNTNQAKNVILFVGDGMGISIADGRPHL